MVPAPPALHALSLHDALPIYPGLHGGGHGDRPLVVLRVEHHRRPVGGGEGEGLGDLALARGAVAEQCHHGGVGALVAGADHAVALQAHRVPDGMGRLGAEHDHVGVGAKLVGVPAAVGDAAEHLQQAPGLDASGPGDAVLAVGGHQVVLLTGGVAGTDLRGLLAQGAGPQAQLPLPLQAGGLEVGGADHHHVAVVAAQPLRGVEGAAVRVLVGADTGAAVALEHGVELGVGGAGAVGGEELDHRLLVRDGRDGRREGTHADERNLRSRKEGRRPRRSARRPHRRGCSRPVPCRGSAVGIPVHAPRRDSRTSRVRRRASRPWSGRAEVTAISRQSAMVSWAMREEVAPERKEGSREAVSSTRSLLWARALAGEPVTAISGIRSSAAIAAASSTSSVRPESETTTRQSPGPRALTAGRASCTLTRAWADSPRRVSLYCRSRAASPEAPMPSSTMRRAEVRSPAARCRTSMSSSRTVSLTARASAAAILATLVGRGSAGSMSPGKASSPSWLIARAASSSRAERKAR